MKMAKPFEKEVPKEEMKAPKHYPTYKHRAMTPDEKKKHAELLAAGKMDKKSHISKLVRSEAEEAALDKKHKWFDEPVLCKEIAADSGYMGDIHPDLGPKMDHADDEFGD